MPENADTSLGTPPRWLDEAERAAWLATAAGLMIRLPSALDTQLQRDSDLTFFEYTVLAILAEQPDRTLRMSDLAELGTSSLSRLSHVVTRLEKQGHLTRERRPGQGRRTDVTLTGPGLAKVQAAAPLHVEAVRRFLIDLLTPDELATLTAIGVKVSRAIDPADDCLARARST